MTCLINVAFLSTLVVVDDNDDDDGDDDGDIS